MSNCEWQDYENPDANGNRRVACINCGYVTRTSTAWPFHKIIRPCSGKPSAFPNANPGSELKKLLLQLGVDKSTDCQCDEMASKMNYWGVEGCHEHRDEILAHLNNAYAELNPSWHKMARIGAVALSLGIIINPTNPAASLLDEALRRAEATRQTSPG